MPTPHEHRRTAESFGVDAERYDRTRPRYPDALIERIVATAPGRDVLDVGIGTGIVARPLRDAGCHVLGVDPDPRMADFARRDGFPVEVATIETWDPAGRLFDAVVAGQSWHWVDPAGGAAKAASVLRPAGRLTVFWNAAQPEPAAATAFAAAYERVMPDTPPAASLRGPLTAAQGYGVLVDKAADALAATGAFAEPDRWRFDWERVHTRDEWLDQLPTTGLMTRLPPARLAEVTAAVGAAIDALGGSFRTAYATLALSAPRLL